MKGDVECEIVIVNDHLQPQRQRHILNVSASQLIENCRTMKYTRS